MPKYKVKGTVTIQMPKEWVIEATTENDVQESLKKVESREFSIATIFEIKEYRTKEWQDLENEIEEYNEIISSMSREELDESCYEQDRDDLETILQLLINKKFVEAAEKRGSLDTAVRERFPDRIDELFDELGIL